MCRDEIVEEVRKIRQAHAERFEYDLDAIVADFKKREGEGGHKVVSLPPRRLKTTDSPVH
jgi:hypothetical protein